MSTPADWGVELKPGQYVRVTAKTGPRFVAEFVIDEIDSDAELISLGSADIGGIYPDRFTVQVLPDPLPTEEGYYLDKHDDLWKIDVVGEPLRYFSRSSGLTSAGSWTPEEYAPFRRLLARS